MEEQARLVRRATRVVEALRGRRPFVGDSSTAVLLRFGSSRKSLRYGLVKKATRVAWTSGQLASTATCEPLEGRKGFCGRCWCSRRRRSLARHTKDGYAHLAAKVASFLDRHPMAAVALARRCPVVVCDEHQDCSGDQHAIGMALLRADPRSSAKRNDVAALQAAADRLSPDIIRKRLDYWTLSWDRNSLPRSASSSTCRASMPSPRSSIAATSFSSATFPFTNCSSAAANSACGGSPPTRLPRSSEPA